MQTSVFAEVVALDVLVQRLKHQAILDLRMMLA